MNLCITILNNVAVYIKYLPLETQHSQWNLVIQDLKILFHQIEPLLNRSYDYTCIFSIMNTLLKVTSIANYKVNNFVLEDHFWINILIFNLFLKEHSWTVLTHFELYSSQLLVQTRKSGRYVQFVESSIYKSNRYFFLITVSKLVIFLYIGSW